MCVLLIFFLTSLVSAQYSYDGDVTDDDVLQANNIQNLQASAPSPFQPAVEEYNKVFYSYTAPEQEFEEPNAVQQINKTIKKNLRIIFIKGPENTALENAALQLVKGASDDHTAIFVLSKQTDIGSLVTQLQEFKSKNTAKPEVHFVKYRSQADAENAQRTIQAQYDSIPGTSSYNGHDTSTVLNFTTTFAPNQSNVSNVNAKTSIIGRSRSTLSSRNSYLSSSRRY